MPHIIIIDAETTIDTLIPCVRHPSALGSKCRTQVGFTDLARKKCHCITDDLDFQGGCLFVALLLHYLFLSAFCWMLCEGIMLYLLLVVVFSRMARHWWLFLLIGYGLYYNYWLISSTYVDTNSPLYATNPPNPNNYIISHFTSWSQSVSIL